MIFIPTVPDGHGEVCRGITLSTLGGGGAVVEVCP